MFSLFCLVLFALVPVCENHCHGAKTSYRVHFISKSLVQDNSVLFGHVFASFSVQNFSHCSSLCRKDCRCRSFNLPMTGEGQCQLNDADNNTAFMKPHQGWRYHHLEEVESYLGDDTCWGVYENGCCSPNPCHVGATCNETVHNGKPTFQCSSCDHNEGKIGELCDKKSYSCIDYMLDNKQRASGLYYIWDNGQKYQVYCHMKPKEYEAWVLVKSFRYSDKTDSGQYMKDLAMPNSVWRNQNNPKSSPFMVSSTVMTNLKNAIEKDGREAEWRITCSDQYTFDDGRGDMVQSRFKILNIMQSMSGACRSVDYISLRGVQCRGNCKVYVQTYEYYHDGYSYRYRYGFTIRPNYHGDCKFGSSNSYSFGAYRGYDTSHDCVKDSSSSTQYWFGGKIWEVMKKL